MIIVIFLMLLKTTLAYDRFNTEVNMKQLKALNTFPSFNTFFLQIISLRQRKLVACFESCQLINAEILQQTIGFAAPQLQNK